MPRTSTCCAPSGASSDAQNAQTERVGGNHRGLIALNAGLIVALGALTLGHSGSSASGQPAGRAVGDYLMVSGRLQGLPEDAIYIIDKNNRELVALRWDSSRKALTTVDALSFREPTGRGSEGRPR